MAPSAGLNTAQRHYFFKSGHLILNEVLSDEQCCELGKEIKDVWSGRIKDRTNLAQMRQSGRDLWRESQSWSSKLFKSPIGHLALQLWSRTSLRILYDQLLFLLPLSSKHDAYRSFSLATASAFEGIEGGILICLQPPKIDQWHLSLKMTERESSGEKISYIDLPNKVGTGIFIACDTWIQWHMMIDHPNLTSGLWMLAAFGNSNARYIFNQGDPNRHLLSALDYTIGEQLRDATHPLIRSIGGATMR